MSDKKDSNRALDAARDIFSSYKTNVQFASVAAENAYRRIEKISAVLYVITNHVPHDEVLNKSLKSALDKLLTNAALLGQGFRAPGHASVEVLETSVRELTTRLRLMVVAGYVSKQNSDIIVSALGELISYIEGAQQSMHADRTTVTRADLLPAEQQAPTAPSQERALAQRRPQDGGESVMLPSVAALHSPRRNVILTILRKGVPLGIKDIAAHIPDCGEKTVQRELAALVAEGAIKKEGEKRWSRYTVV